MVTLVPTVFCFKRLPNVFGLKVGENALEWLPLDLRGLSRWVVKATCAIMTNWMRPGGNNLSRLNLFQYGSSVIFG